MGKNSINIGDNIGRLIGTHKLDLFLFLKL